MMQLSRNIFLEYERVCHKLMKRKICLCMLLPYFRSEKNRHSSHYCSYALALTIYILKAMEFQLCSWKLEDTSPITVSNSSPILL